MKILLFRGRGLISALIRWQTGSQYSHAAALVDDTWLYEAWQGKGVRVKRFDWSDIDNIDFFEIDGLTSENEARMLEYLKSRVGNKYDYWGVLRFITRGRPKSNNADFCSEYIYAAAEYTQLALLARTEPAEVSPGLLGRSPYLSQIPVSFPSPRWGEGQGEVPPILPISPIPEFSDA